MVANFQNNPILTADVILIWVQGDFHYMRGAVCDGNQWRWGVHTDKYPATALPQHLGIIRRRGMRVLDLRKEAAEALPIPKGDETIPIIVANKGVDMRQAKEAAMIATREIFKAVQERLEK